MADPVGPASKISQFSARRGPNPRRDAALAVFEGRPHFTDHECVGNEVDGEHDDPTDDGLESLIGVAIDDVAKAPDLGKGHET